jgi:hypothetical protein
MREPTTFVGPPEVWQGDGIRGTSAKRITSTCTAPRRRNESAIGQITDPESSIESFVNQIDS